MIDIRKADIVLTRLASDGRFVIFTSTDARPSWPVRWWGAVADTKGDGFSLLVRLDQQAASAGWTARELLAIARARLAAELDRTASPATAAALACLDLAAGTFRAPLGEAECGDPVTFHPGGEVSPYPWSIARCGDYHLPLCPDPIGDEEGITLEQLLIVLDQLLHDAARAYSFERGLWVCRRHVSAALALEVRRVTDARSLGPPAPPAD